MSGYLAKRCPECDNQFPTSFDSCIYCGADLREVEPSEYKPLNMTPGKPKQKRPWKPPRPKNLNQLIKDKKIKVYEFGVGDKQW